ncbi:universal stress protein [Cyclobacterium plantarum]|uniref:Universal stress protein n=1 Tax=Cyclobacterium plantarum TaxID=2716263 RepID=A0ABX0H7L3_9BACT|nr:universal stress protein [Cyclobacterium plantarum]NHE56373.1 universal stress protein [Cyclobacterium plantarum]
MKKLLVPTDFSTYADAALDFAVHLAQKVDAEILIMHVILTPVNWAKLTREQEKLYPDTLEVIKKAKIELSTRKSKISALGLTVSELLHFSDGKERVIQFLSLEKIDMVVMGSHGKYGFKSHVLGSNTYTVLRKSEVPVFIVKPGEEAFSFKKVVLATDFKESSAKAFQVLGDTIRLLGGEIELLYVNTPANFMEDQKIREMGAQFLEKFAFYTHGIHIYGAYNVERGIIQYAKAENADAVALITHGKTDLQQLFSPSVTENLVTYLDKPVISLNVTTKDK